MGAEARPRGGQGHLARGQASESEAATRGGEGHVVGLINHHHDAGEIRALRGARELNRALDDARGAGGAAARVAAGRQR